MVKVKDIVDELRPFIEALSDGVVLIDFKGALLFANVPANTHLISDKEWETTPLFKKLTAVSWTAKLKNALPKQTVSLDIDWEGGPIQLVVLPNHKDNVIAVIVKEQFLSNTNSTTQELERLKKEFHEFAYIISHDLQAPVRAVKSLVDWFKEDYEEAVDTAGKEQLELMKERITHLGKMVEGILEFSRINRKDITARTLDLKTVISKVMKTVQPKDGIQFEVIGTLPIVRANEKKMMRLFTALLENAFRFAKETVQLTIHDTKTDYRIEITDDGEGIPETKHEHVFKVFQTLSKDPIHIGLGLPLAKKIVDFYKGTIWLETDKVLGCTINISLPKSVIQETQDQVYSKQLMT